MEIGLGLDSVGSAVPSAGATGLGCRGDSVIVALGGRSRHRAGGPHTARLNCAGFDGGLQAHAQPTLTESGMFFSPTMGEGSASATAIGQ